ncbi:MAG: cysteine desulfurase family protein [Planctomycetia bacterium]
MENRQIYLDASATTPLREEVWEAMRPYALEKFGNASSSHGSGRKARQALEDSREERAALLGAFPDEVVFTSGATEANNIAIYSATLGNVLPIYLSRLEHASITTPVEKLGQNGRLVVWQKVKHDGIVDLGSWNKDEAFSLACLMLVNHETGMNQPVAELGQKLAGKGWLHCDAVQAVGKQRVDFHRLCVQSLSLSAHKFHGPKGVGALLVRRGSNLAPMFLGGGQEKSVRPGTEPVASIVGMACALRLANQNLEQESQRLKSLKQVFFKTLQSKVPWVVLNGTLQGASAHLLNLAFPGLRSDLLLMKLDMLGVACSTGSACSSGSLLPSPVLKAMAVEDAVLGSSMRFSFHALLSEMDVAEAADRVATAAHDMKIA